MEKKQYIVPTVEVMNVGACMMYGEASLPKDPFSAPERHTTVTEAF